MKQWKALPTLRHFLCPGKKIDYNNIFILNEIKVPVQDWNNIVDDAFLEERGKNFIGNKKNFTSFSKLMDFY